MAVYKRTYKSYRGAMTPAWSRFLVLARYGLSTLFTSRPFTAYTVVCFFPFLFGLIAIYVLHSTAALALVGADPRRIPQIGNYAAMTFLGFEAWMSFLLTAWGAPGMISKDFANHSIQLYLSRPLSRAEYLLGKVSVLGILLSCTTWIPALILFVVQAQLEGNGWGWHNLWLAGSIVVAAMLGIALVSLISMSISVWVRWRIAATALMIGIFFFLPAFSGIFNLILRTQWGSLLNFIYVMSVIWANLFRVPEQQRHAARLDLIPLWAAWATVFAVCTICLWLLHSRLKAREVERG